MHVLVAGGSGFLGSHLCDALIAERHWVITVGNLLTGREENYGLPPVLRGGHAYCPYFQYLWPAPAIERRPREPTIDLETGLKISIAYFQECLALECAESPRKD
jgi:hypothetical protein